MRLLGNLQYGWAFPKRAKKAHYFNSTKDNRDKSACGKYSIGWTNGKSYLPISAFWDKHELCSKCWKAFNNY
jgi:hypothetical protein